MDKCQLIKFKKFTDERGSLIPFEINNNCPFDIKRTFVIYGVGNEKTERANHVNTETNQVLIALAGTVTIDINENNTTTTYVLNNIEEGLYIKSGVHKRLYKFSKDAVILSLCDNYYNPSEYK